MQNSCTFRGVATALGTPFRDGQIDYTALGELIERQIREGVGTLVIAGTTGEASTLSDRERRELYAFSTERVGGRARVILGTGSPDTARAAELTRAAAEAGADGALIVTPYYNKGTDAGVIYHYQKIANSVDLPIILYNIPSRTGVNLPISSIRSLIKEENIVGIKEATDGIERQMELYALADRTAIYCGNDSQIYLNLALGGAGCISVLSNLLPREALSIYRLWDDGRQKEALALQMRLAPLVRALFLETNPAPLKYAMELLGLCRGELRLPLTEAKEATRECIRRELRALGYIG